MVTIVEACEDSALLISEQITSSRSQQMRTPLHLLGESGSIETQTNSSHFSHGKAAVDHVLTPLVHGLSPGREPVWHVAHIYFLLLFGKISDAPEIPPFGIKLRRLRSHSLVSLGIVADDA